MAAEMIVDIRKAFPDFLVDTQLAISVEGPRVLILFGPSGSGKTTLLRCLAGLERPDRGTIRLGRDLWFDGTSGVHVSPQSRHIGFMFQDYALFPNLTVTGNIGYGLASLPKEERARRVNDTIELLKLQGLEQATPSQLSGGQQQRVALARAIATRPRLLLLDEPLSALDMPTRLTLRGELRGLLKRLGIPSIVVTHDWEEALALGDHMVVLSGGRVRQTGIPQQVFNAPTDVEVARIVGMETIVPGRVIESANGLLTVEAGGVKMQALGSEEPGTDVFVCIRAEDVTLEPVGNAGTSARNHLAGRVRAITSIGALARVDLDCGVPLSAVITRPALEELRLVEGSSVKAALKAGAVHLVPRRQPT